MVQSDIFHVYILSNSVGKHYIGQTRNLDERLDRHNTNRSKYTSHKGPWKIIYSEVFTNRSDAIAREKQLKKWRKDRLLKFIESRSKG